MKVLYIEDHPINVMLMESLFALRPNLQLQVAMTGEEGYKAAEANPPDLLLVDLRLPDCHGTQLLERLRQLPGLRSVPAAAVTAEKVRDGECATFNEVWPKPLDLARTLARLDSLQAQHTGLPA